MARKGDGGDKVMMSVGDGRDQFFLDQVPATYTAIIRDTVQQCRPGMNGETAYPILMSRLSVFEKGWSPSEQEKEIGTKVNRACCVVQCHSIIFLSREPERSKRSSVS